MKEEQNNVYIQAKIARAKRDKDHDGHVGSDRLPPGQALTEQFPILDLGVRPSRADYAGWELLIDGAVESPTIFSFEEIKKLSNIDFVKDFHCVTKWSRFAIPWKGVSFSEIEKAVRPTAQAKFVVLYSFDNYTTNIPLEEMRKEGVFVAHTLEGEEIPPEHGGPIRMIIPQLYGWKSAKFLTRIEFTNEDQPGFWETRGYSNTARPWKEERYS